MREDLTITYSTPDDRKGVVAEIWAGKSQVAEISDDPGYLVIEFYARPDGRTMCVGLDELARAMEQAKKGLRKKPSDGSSI